MLGAAFVFFMKRDMPERLQKALLGFASGVMVAASVWSLLIPSIEMSHGEGAMQVIPAAVGFLLGILFLLAIDELTPHLHVGANTPEGPRSHLSRTAMLTDSYLTTFERIISHKIVTNLVKKPAYICTCQIFFVPLRQN